MDGTTEYRDTEEEFSYKIDYGPSKDKMFYVMMFYVSFIIGGILLAAWKLRGYNRPDVGLQQALGIVDKAEGGDGAVEHEKLTLTGSHRRRNIRQKIKDNATETRNEPNARDEKMQDDDFEDDSAPAEKIGAKKLKKLQEKEERKKMREMAEMERAERKKQLEEKEKARKVEEERQLEIEKQKEEEEKREREQKEKEEHELYLEMKKSFEVNEEGEIEISSDKDVQNQLQVFVQYIIEKKVVLLEDLASHFGMRTKDAIERVQDLLKDEILTGVIDDRGKFIYISRDELESVAKFVKQRGRISLSELAAASNSLFHLETVDSVM